MTGRLDRLSSLCIALATVLLVGSGFAAEPQAEWHLIRSADPRGGVGAVAMMHTADVSKSDIGLAGLMLRCSPDRLQVVIVATIAFAPSEQPRVRLRAGRSESTLTATIVPPFSALLLPSEATELVDGVWQSASELLIEITSQQAVIKGTISMAGLKSAAAILRANCPLP
jgi:hypothetical protein